MTIGIVGKKIGMTRIFTSEGRSLAVTVIEAQPNRVTQVKSNESDGYIAVQVTAGLAKRSGVNKAQAGIFSKASVEAGNGFWEFRHAGQKDLELGSTITLEEFDEGQKVDIRGVSKGKGFAGVVKRHNFKTQDMSHGNSVSHRAPGSIGQCQTPGRVFKGKKMAGHMGASRVTTQGLEIVKIDVEKSLLLVKGAVAGAVGGDVLVFPSVKTSRNEAP
ncbi:MAG: 50S ribosomal protein L3 [Gammaproteobacteria bacterium]|nr:50S ribosomal protein L3 [Gammaproteobacteria bacterium]